MVVVACSTSYPVFSFIFLNGKNVVLVEYSSVIPLSEIHVQRWFSII